MPLVKLIVIPMLVAIVVNLASALYQLARGTGDSKQMLRALTWRIGLSVGLFVLLLLAFRAGLITPLRSNRRIRINPAIRRRRSASTRRPPRRQNGVAA